MEYLTRQEAIKLFGEIATERIKVAIGHQLELQIDDLKSKLDKLNVIDRITNDLKMLFK